MHFWVCEDSEYALMCVCVVCLTAPCCPRSWLGHPVQEEQRSKRGTAPPVRLQRRQRQQQRRRSGVRHRLSIRAGTLPVSGCGRQRCNICRRCCCGSTGPARGIAHSQVSGTSHSLPPTAATCLLLLAGSSPPVLSLPFVRPITVVLEYDVRMG